MHGDAIQPMENGDWGLPVWLELEEGVRQLAKVVPGAVEEMLKLPNAAQLVTRLVEGVVGLNMVALDGSRAAGERRTKDRSDLAELKTAFLRLTAHELRRPLALLNGHLSLIREGTYGPVPDGMRPGLQQLEGSAQQMSRLIDGLAEVARAEDGAAVLRRGIHRLGELVKAALEAVGSEAEAKRMSLVLEVPEPDIIASVDGDRLLIAVTNLIANAIKYAPDGSTVTVDVARNEREAWIAVADQGPGINPNEARTIFGAWRRASGTEVPGLGLGLYIAKLVAELHGGRVTLDSQPGQGSTFTLLVPCGQGQRASS